MVILFTTTIFLRKGFQIFFNDNATLGPVTYVTKFLENDSLDNVTNNFHSTLNFQNYVLYYIFATLFDISLY